MSDFESRFIKRLFGRMLWGGIGVSIAAVYWLIKGAAFSGTVLLIFGLLCVAGSLIYKMVNKNR